MALFNKDSRGSEELNDLTGFFHADNRFENIAAEIDSAITEVSALVGRGVIDRAEADYKAGTNPGFVKMVQMPVACLAISRYFKLLGVSHGDSGRKLKIDANEKIPFEWMLDRDDRAMHEKYCRALDALYTFLERENIEEWRESDVRRSLAESIVRTLIDFERVYPIEHSYYTYFMLLPLIIEVQNSRLRKTLGDAWSRISGPTIDEADRGILYFAQRVAVLNAVITAVERWSIEVFPQSIARRFMPTYQGDRASKTAAVGEMDWYLSRLRSQAAEAIEDMVAAIHGNDNPYKDYPLLPENEKRKKYFNAGV